MMTSALLTMLDTPEEAAAEGYEFDQEALDQHGHLPQPGMPLTAALGQDLASSRPGDGNGPASALQDGVVYGGERMYGGLAVNSPVAENQYQDTRNLGSEENTTWLPNWQGTKTVAHGYEGGGQMSVIQQRHHPDPPHNNDVGLFLP